jgi:hypothetical protein
MAAVLALLLVLIPSVAAACPACIGVQDSFTTRMMALGVMILFPFAIAFFVIRSIRKALRE